jgi:hypothetical protein
VSSRRGRRLGRRCSSLKPNRRCNAAYFPTQNRHGLGLSHGIQAKPPALGGIVELRRNRWLCPCSGSKAEPWHTGLWVVLSAGLLYGLLHAMLRLALSTNLPQDDVTANILAQTLEPGYLPRQPPLYEWLLWTVQRVAGPTLPSFLVIKYGLLTATFGFLYLIGLRIFTERNWAILAALSPLLLSDRLESA